MNTIDAKLNLTLHDNQRRVHESTAKHKVVKAGKRFGKTKWAIFEICRAAGLNPGGLYWYISPTYRMSKQIAWWELKMILPRAFVKRYLETDLTVELINESRIQLIGADNEDSLRGPKIDGVILDECAYIKEYVWPAIISGQLLGSQGKDSGFAYFISSPLRPKMGGESNVNWFKDFHEDAARKEKAGDPEWSAFHFSIFDNPTLQKSQIEKLKAGVSDEIWNLEYMAIESELAGQLFHEFSPERNVGDAPPANTFPLVRAIDWGISHPTVCLWIQFNLATREVWVTDEFVKSGFVIQESCDVIKKMTGDRPVEWTVIDPSTSKRNSQTLRTDKDEFQRWGIPCVGGDNRDRGYDIVKTFLKRGLLKISPRCKNLIYELKNLQWGDKTGDDVTDALRYAMVRIHDETFGGNVFTSEAAPSIPQDRQSEAYTKYLEKVREYNFNNQFLFPESKPETPTSWVLEEIA